MKTCILLVDDRPDSLTALEGMLQDPEIQIFKAQSGNEALRLTLKHDFAIVLLDVMMPEMDGFETAELMRANPKTRNLPIVFLTAAFQDARLQFKGYEAGAVDYLPKPVAPAILRTKVKIFCDLYRHRQQVESHERQLEMLVQERTAQLTETNVQLQRELADRKQAEEKITHLAAIIESTDDAVIGKTLDEKIVSWNRGAEKLYGYTAAEVIGQPISILVPADRQEELDNLMARLKRGENVRHLETTRLRKGGQPIQVALTISPIKDAKGGIVGASIIARDITERKQAEDEVRRLNQELEQRVAQRTAALEQTNKELETFSYSVSHDLRAPLRAISGFSRILQQDYSSVLDDEGRHLLDRVCHGVVKMDRLIDDILAFSRMARAEMGVQTLNMTVLAREVFEQLQAGVPDRKLRLILAPLPASVCDQAMLRQVWSNLLGNAIKYTAKRDEALIEISGSVQGAQNLYCVKDNGIGFDMQDAGRLFGTFQRLHSANDFEGTGIGLAIVKRIIERHGGKVWAEGKADAGATFYFTLPASAATCS